MTRLAISAMQVIFSRSIPHRCMGFLTLLYSWSPNHNVMTGMLQEGPAALGAYSECRTPHTAKSFQSWEDHGGIVSHLVLSMPVGKSMLLQ